MINLFNLRLKDINKEMEYRLVASSIAALERHSQLIVSNLIFNSMIACLKMADHFLVRAASGGVSWTTAISSEILIITASLAALYVNKKIPSIRNRWVVYALIVVVNAACNVYFFVDPENSLIQVKFLYAIAFTHVIGQQQAFFLVSFVSALSSIGFLNIRISVI